MFKTDVLMLLSLIAGCSVMPQESTAERLKLCITILESPILIGGEGRPSRDIVSGYVAEISSRVRPFPKLASVQCPDLNYSTNRSFCARHLEKYMSEIVQADEANGLLVLEYCVLYHLVGWMFYCSDQHSLTDCEQINAWAKTLARRLDLGNYDPTATKPCVSVPGTIPQFKDYPPKPARMLAAEVKGTKQ